MMMKYTLEHGREFDRIKKISKQQVLLNLTVFLIGWDEKRIFTLGI
jgi:hypothetical protein